MISDYRRGLEDALDVAIFLVEKNDTRKLVKIRDDLRQERIDFILDCPSLVSYF